MAAILWRTERGAFWPAHTPFPLSSLGGPESEGGSKSLQLRPSSPNPAPGCACQHLTNISLLPDGHNLWGALPGLSDAAFLGCQEFPLFLSNQAQRPNSVPQGMELVVLISGTRWVREVQPRFSHQHFFPEHPRPLPSNPKNLQREKTHLLGDFIRSQGPSPTFYLAKRELILSHVTDGKTEASKGSGLAQGYTSAPFMSCAPVAQNGWCSLSPLHPTTHRSF